MRFQLFFYFIRIGLYSFDMNISILDLLSIRLNHKTRHHKWMQNHRSFLLWAVYKPDLSLNKKEKTRYKKVATVIATPKAWTYQNRQRIYQGDLLHEIPHKLEWVFLLGLEIKLKPIVVRGI